MNGRSVSRCVQNCNADRSRAVAPPKEVALGCLQTSRRTAPAPSRGDTGGAIRDNSLRGRRSGRHDHAQSARRRQHVQRHDVPRDPRLHQRDPARDAHARDRASPAPATSSSASAGARTGMEDTRLYAGVLPTLEMYEAIERLQKPVIASVNGFAVGGGNVLQVRVRLHDRQGERDLPAGRADDGLVRCRLRHLVSGGSGRQEEGQGDLVPQSEDHRPRGAGDGPHQQGGARRRAEGGDARVRARDRRARRLRAGRASRPRSTPATAACRGCRAWRTTCCCAAISTPRKARSCRRRSPRSASPIRPSSGKSEPMRPFLTLHHPAAARRYYEQGVWRSDTFYALLARHAAERRRRLRCQDGRRTLTWTRAARLGRWRRRRTSAKRVSRPATASRSGSSNRLEAVVDVPRLLAPRLRLQSLAAPHLHLRRDRQAARPAAARASC